MNGLTLGLWLASLCVVWYWVGYSNAKKKYKITESVQGASP